jgi:chemotaxis-related protein WspD
MNAIETQRLQATRCWNRIGDWGDHSYPELKEWIHCQNCPVLSSAGRSLFDQAPPADYIEEWGKLLAAEENERALLRNSILVFRLGDEWLGLPAAVFQSMEDPRTIHRVPHRSNKVLLGVVNIRGALQLCISLRDLLDIPPSTVVVGERDSVLSRKRLAFVDRGGDRWAFPLDEALGIHRYHSSEVQNAPVTVAKQSAPFTKGLLAIQDRTVGLLDEELVFYHLKRNALG